jgi:hypothetical protein
LDVASASITVDDLGFVVVALATLGHIDALTQLVSNRFYTRSIEIRIKIDVLDVIGAITVICPMTPIQSPIGHDSYFAPGANAKISFVNHSGS